MLEAHLTLIPCHTYNFLQPQSKIYSPVLLSPWKLKRSERPGSVEELTMASQQDERGISSTHKLFSQLSVEIKYCILLYSYVAYSFFVVLLIYIHLLYINLNNKTK